MLTGDNWTAYGDPQGGKQYAEFCGCAPQEADCASPKQVAQCDTQTAEQVSAGSQEGRKLELTGVETSSI